MEQRVDHFDEPIVRFVRKDFTSLPSDFDVAAALEWIRHKGARESILYFYVVNQEQQLVGVLPTRRLLTAQLNHRVAELMVSRVVAIPESATVLDACELFLMHKFLAFPVVDDQRRIVGIVDVNLFTGEVLDLSEKERMDDVFQTIGFRVAQVQRASPLKSFGHRFPWLLATMAGGIACAFLAGAYETTLARSLILAFFLTLVLGLGESVSVQSLTVTIQALHAEPLTFRWFIRAIRKELATAALLGGASGLIVGLVAWLWRGNGLAAIAIGASLVVAVSVACVTGLIVPSLLHRFRLDPKIAAGPVALALADVFTVTRLF